MDGYDDLGPPTHPNELALDAEIAGEREIDDGVGGIDAMGDGFGDAPEFEAPEFADFGDVEQVIYFLFLSHV